MSFPISTPSAQGIDPTTLLELVETLDADPRIEPHGLIVQRHGHRVLEAYWSPHRSGQARLVYSLSKSFTGAALGLALGDGLLSLDDLVVDHLGDLMADADETTRRMRIRHIASMSSGHHDETLLDAFIAAPEDPLRGFFTLPPQHEPGTWFAYNQPPVLALSTILHRVSGVRLVDQLRTRVLEPIGIEDLRWYQYRPGVDLGFSGVFTDLDAIARFGQLHLEDGSLDGRQLLPAGWVAEASRPQITNEQRPEPDWRRGYGFQLWMCRHGYRGDGAYGQYMVVLPEQDAVIALFSNTENMQIFMDLIWDRMLPAFAPAPDPDPTGDAALAERVTDLQLPTAAQRTGWGRRPGEVTDAVYRPAEGAQNHPSINAIDVADGHLVLHEGEHVTRVPLSSTWVDVPGVPISASAAANEAGDLAMDLVMRATPHRIEITTQASKRTFVARWPLHPLFGMGLEPVLATMGPPRR
ncbi:MAG: beta-lactamase family protein [Actinobacteria bacterium]|nr:beta-lactamase family protein [Actinomycetota bacterium]